MAITATTAAIITAVAAAASAAQAYSAGQTQKKQFGQQAELQRRQAVRERQISEVDAQRFARQQSKALAQRRVALAAAGIDPSLGTALLGTEEMAGEAEFDRLLILAGGQARENVLLSDAAQSRFKGRAAAAAGTASAGTSLLSGAAGVGKLYVK